MKKILAILLALTMIVGLGLTAWAVDADGDGIDDETNEPVVNEPTEGEGEGDGGEAATTGTIVIQNATKGHTYTAYKIFDATYSGDAVSYTTPAENEDLLDSSLFGWSAPDANGNISVWALEDADESAIIDWMKANYAAFGGTPIEGEFDETNSTVTFDNLDFGYYYITSSLGSAVTITTVAPSAEVYDKNFVEPTGPEKKIIAVDGEEQDKVTEANAHVGSVVTFEVTANAVNWTGEKETEGSIETVTDTEITTEWTFTDTATGMFVDPETIVVTVNGTEITNFTAAGDGNGGFTLTIPMVDENGNSIYDAPEDGLIPIVVTYDATILAAAATAPAKNEIPGPNPPPPVVIYTYGFQIVKTDENEEPLPGAQFELWANGAALTFIDNGDGTYTYSPDGTVTTLDMTTNTTISVLGLDQSWEYTLKEITVPDGYNKAEDITVPGNDLTQIGEYTFTPITDEDGNITGWNEEYTETDTSITSEELHQEVVINKSGTVLPSTGGIGTTIFYIVGGLLAVGAGVVLVTKKRMGKEDV